MYVHNSAGSLTFLLELGSPCLADHICDFKDRKVMQVMMNAFELEDFPRDSSV